LRGVAAEPLSEILTRAPTEALAAFLHRWHGLASVPRAPAGVPRALRRFRQLDAFLTLNQVLYEPRVEEGKALFYVEEQGVAVWGVDELDDDDPPVWCRFCEPDARWEQDAPSMSMFVLQLVVMNAACDPPLGGCAPVAGQDLLASLHELALPAWHWPASPARFYAGDETVAFACPNGPGALCVWLGSLTEEALRAFAPQVDDSWEYFSLEE
jgi:hypothetical protein